MPLDTDQISIDEKTNTDKNDVFEFFHHENIEDTNTNNNNDEVNLDSIISSDFSPNSTFSNDDDNNPDSKDIIALMKVISGDSIEVEALSDIPRAVARIIPNVIERLVKEYETLYNDQKSLEQKVSFLTGSKDAQREIFMEALNSDRYSADKLQYLHPEARSLVTDYVALRTKISDIEDKLSKIKSQIQKAQEYVEDYGLKTKVRPELEDEFEVLMDSIDRSMSRVAENLRLNLYRQISSALSEGYSDSLPEDLMELIHKLVIERLESILKPYDELSAKYVSGELTHDQFTDLLRKNALFSLLREKVVADVTREFENNNLSSPIIPNRLRMATERMLIDARNLGRIISDDSTVRIFNNDGVDEPKRI